MDDYTTRLLGNLNQIAQMKIWKMKESADWYVDAVSIHTLPWYKRIFNRNKGDVMELRIIEDPHFRYRPQNYKPEAFNRIYGEEYFFNGEVVYDRPIIRFWFSNNERYTKYFKTDEEMLKWIKERPLLEDFIQNNMVVIEQD